jgi:hypothetical protein
MEYLGFVVTGGKLSMSTQKVKAVKESPVPKTQRKARSFLQFCKFYAEFIHHISDLSMQLRSFMSNKS